MNIHDKRIEFFDKMYEIFGEENLQKDPKFFIKTCVEFAASLLYVYQVPEDMAKDGMLKTLENIYAHADSINFRNFVNPNNENTH